MSLSKDEARMLTEVHTTVMKQIAPWVQDHEDRLRKVERSHLKFLGGATVISGIIGFIMPWLRGGI